jgi:hypothetical protein
MAWRVTIAAVAVFVAVAGAARSAGADVRVEVTHDSRRVRWNAWVIVERTDGPIDGPVIGVDGACTVHAKRTLLDADGGAITVTGPVTGPVTVPAREHAIPLPDLAVAPGVALAISAAGGADVPAFAASVVAPAPLAGLRADRYVPRAGYPVTWDAGSGAEVDVQLAIANAEHETAALVACRTTDTGAFTVPASTLALVPPAFTIAKVTAERVARTEQMVGATKVMFEVRQQAMLDGPACLCEAAAAEVPTRNGWGRWQYELGTAYAADARGGALPYGSGIAFDIDVAGALTRSVDLITVAELTGLTTGSAATSMNEVAFLVGARWPTPRSRRSLLSPYVVGAIGIDLHDLVTATGAATSTTQRHDGPLARAGVGTVIVHGRDWRLVMELRGRLARVDGAFQPGFEAGFGLQLDLF